MAPERLPINVRKFNTVIADVATTGNSGSGVFDADRRCLLGIMKPKDFAIAGAAGDRQNRNNRYCKILRTGFNNRRIYPGGAAFLNSDQ